MAESQESAASATTKSECPDVSATTNTPTAGDKTKEETPSTAAEASASTLPNQQLIESMDKFRALGQKAFVVGASGEVGKELVKEICRSKIFSNLTVIGRRELKYEDDLYKDIELVQTLVNFDELETKHSDDFKGFDVGYCCLGTTRGKAGVEGFKKVDHDYVVNVAKLAKAGSCRHFNLVSAQGSNKNSSLLYPKTKGLCEEHVQELEFERYSIYKPGMLLCDREEKRSFEYIASKLLKPIEYFFPTAMTAPTVSVAKAMVNNTVSSTDKPVEIFSNKDIRILAGDVKK